MINVLPDLKLQFKANQCWQYSGGDTPERFQKTREDKQRFSDYPYKIEYKYNSRGFRDAEWPDSLDELKNAIWCIGDSFTAGIGQALENTWPQVLAQATGRRTINVSMDGASNNWISRRTCDIIRSINPKNLVVMWSYIERREIFREKALEPWWQEIYNQIRDESWPANVKIADIEKLPEHIKLEITDLHGIPLPLRVDDEFLRYFRDYSYDELLRVQDVDSDIHQHFKNWQTCVDSVCNSPNVVHAVIPAFVQAEESYLIFWEYLKSKNNKLIQFDRLDWARDQHHFDILTAQNLVSRLVPLL